MFKKLVQLVSEQNSYIGTFQVYATQQHVDSYIQLTSQAPFKEVASYREKAFSGDLAQNAEEWFAASTKRINLLKKQEDSLTDEILDSSARTVTSNSNAFWFYLAVSAALILVSSYFSITLMRGINKQVSCLNDTMSRAADKDLVFRCQAIGKDELGMIASNLNRMLHSFTDAVHIISASSEQLATVSEESTVIVQENASALRVEQQQVLQVVSAMEEMSVSIKEVAENIRHTSQEANSANELITSSNQVVEESTESIHQVSSHIDSVADTISDLHESSGNISGVVDVIQGIAEQTNLLALNAAIEAARAGEYGRGFAVVADEVRSLAQRTQESTLEIEGMVKKLQQDSDSAFEQVKDTKEFANTSVEKSSQVREALVGVVSSIDSISQMAVEISAAAEQQVIVSTDISSNAQSISDNVQQSVDSGEQIAVVAQEQAQLADKLKQLASQFKTA